MTVDGCRNDGEGFVPRLNGLFRVPIRATLFVTVGTASLTCACLTGSQRSIAADSAPTMPSTIAVPDSQALVFEATVVRGVQAYRCTPEHKYALVGPTAWLQSKAGDYVAHYAGPAWQHQDGSSIVGALLAHTPVPNAIDDLLVKVVQHGGHQGLFDTVEYIQRIATSGGVAPPACDPSKNSTLVLPYSATYRFWAPKS